MEPLNVRQWSCIEEQAKKQPAITRIEMTNTKCALCPKFFAKSDLIIDINTHMGAKPHWSHVHCWWEMDPLSSIPPEVLSKVMHAEEEELIEWGLV